MVTTADPKQSTEFITRAELIKYWQGHRSLTRRTFDAFPEKDFFEFSIGGMRKPAELLQELLAIEAPGLGQIALGTVATFNEPPVGETTKEQMLRLWDESSEQINQYWEQLPDDAFHKEGMLFGMYPGTGWSSILYFITNQVHHRGQAYVYLRALGIEPPFFWEV